MSSRLRISFLALVLILTCFTGSSQNAPPGKAHDEPLRFSATAKYVLVPVVVTDHDGNHVPGLTKSDFRVLENSKEQKVASLEEIRATARPIARAATAPNEFTNEDNGDAAPRRLVIVLLDLLNTDFADQVYARRGFISFVADHLDPGTLYEIVSLEMPSMSAGRLTVLHDYTSDAKPLMEAAKAIRAGVGPATAEAPFTGLSSLMNTSRVQANDVGDIEAQLLAADRTTVTLKAFEQLANRVAGIPGRKEMIWLTSMNPVFTDPAVMDLPEVARQSFVSNKLRLRAMKALEDAQISIYPVDPKGLDADEWNASGGLPRFKSAPTVGSIDNKHRVDFSPTVMEASNARRQRQESLRAIADLTGGRAYLNRNDTDNLIRDAVHDGSSYYMLSYAVDKSNTLPGWRRISVHARNCHVRARTGYFLDNAALDPVATMSPDIDLALTSPLDYTALPLRLKIGDPVAADGKYKVGFTLLVRKGAVHPDSGDNNRLHVAYSYAVRTAAGDDAGHKGSVVDRHLTSAQLRQVENDGIGYADTLELAPGSYTLRVVARDNLTGRMGSVMGTLQLK